MHLNSPTTQAYCKLWKLRSLYAS